MGIFSRRPKPTATPAAAAAAPPHPSESQLSLSPASVRSLATELAHPAIVFQPQLALCSDADSTSWLGGCPRMPADLPWPVTTEAGETPVGTPLHFLAQIDCWALPAQAARANGIPNQGTLWFFADMWGDVEQFAVLYSSNEPAAFKERLPGRDAVAVYGSEYYSDVFGTYEIDRTLLQHQASLPRTPLAPMPFMSVPSFTQLVAQKAIDVPRVWYQADHDRTTPSLVTQLAGELTDLRSQALTAALGNDLDAEWDSYAALARTAFDVTTDMTNPAGFVISRYAAAAAAHARSVQSSEARALLVSATQLAEHLSQTASLDSWSEIDGRGAALLSELQRRLDGPEMGSEHVRLRYFRDLEMHLSQLALLGQILGTRAPTVPPRAQAALARLSAPAYYEQKRGEKDPGGPSLRGVIQMGGYCAGSQYEPCSTSATTPLLSVGWLPELGFAIGDGGDIFYETAVGSLTPLVHGTAPETYGDFQCH